MINFIAGNCVSLPFVCEGRDSDYRNRNTEYYGSFHILSEKEITQGYYWCNNGTESIDLSLCEHARPTRYLRNRCQTLKGKVTQPINFLRFCRVLINRGRGASDKVYINFKGVNLRFTGKVSLDRKMFYFAHNSVYYKTKVYVNPEGYVVGLTKHTPLGDKQKRNSTRFLD